MGVESAWKVRGKFVKSAWKVRGKLRGYGRGKCLESCGGMWAWKVRGKFVESWRVRGKSRVWLGMFEGAGFEGAWVPVGLQAGLL